MHGQQHTGEHDPQQDRGHTQVGTKELAKAALALGLVATQRELGVVIDVHRRIHRLDAPRDLLAITTAIGKEQQGFRQHDRQHQSNNSGHYGTHHKNRLPPIGRHQFGGHHARQAAAQRDAQNNQTSKHGAAGAWRHFRRQGYDVGQHATQTHTGDETHDRQTSNAGSLQRQQRCNAVQQRADDNELLAADAIAKAAQKDGADHHAEQIGRLNRTD